MAIETRISNEAYERLALAESDRKWELANGALREKPPMTFEHNWLGQKLAFMLMAQLDWSVYQVRSDSGRIRRPNSTYFIPDVFVLLTEYTRPFRHRDDILEVFDQPMPLVVEVWSPSTGNYDIKEKLAAYKHRGDLEIWSIQPYERRLTAWRRQPDGSYDEETFGEGSIEPVALPNVTIDLTALYNN